MIHIISGTHLNEFIINPICKKIFSQRELRSSWSALRRNTFYPAMIKYFSPDKEETHFTWQWSNTFHMARKKHILLGNDLILFTWQGRNTFHLARKNTFTWQWRNTFHLARKKHIVPGKEESASKQETPTLKLFTCNKDTNIILDYLLYSPAIGI